MSETKCIFCNIYNGKESADILFKDNDFVVFRDIRPASKHHFLVVPKDHIVNVKQLTKEQSYIVEDLLKHGKRILEENGADLKDSRFGFHWPPFNSIPHLHLHAISPASGMSFINKIIFQESSLWFVNLISGYPEGKRVLSVCPGRRQPRGGSGTGIWQHLTASPLGGLTSTDEGPSVL